MDKIQEAQLRKYLPLLTSSRTKNILFALQKLQMVSGKIPKKILLDILHREDEILIIEVLGYIKKYHRNQLSETVERYLYHKDPKIRLRAFQTYLTLKNPAKYDLTLRLLSVEKDEQIIVFLLKEISETKNRLFLTPIESHFGHESPRIRSCALESIHHLCGKVSESIMKKAQKDPHHRVRGAATKILIEQGRVKLDSLNPDLDSSDELTRRTALFVRGSMADESAFLFLKEQFNKSKDLPSRRLILRLLIEFHFPLFQKDFFDFYIDAGREAGQTLLQWYDYHRPNLASALEKALKEAAHHPDRLFPLLHFLKKSRISCSSETMHSLFSHVAAQHRWRLFSTLKTMPHPEMESLITHFPPLGIKDRLAWYGVLASCEDVQSLQKMRDVLSMGNSIEKQSIIRHLGNSPVLLARKFLIEHLEHEKDELICQKIRDIL